MMNNILEDLELFRKQLQEYYFYRQNIIIEEKAITKQQLTRVGELHDELAVKAGKYGNLIADVTKIEPVISTSSGQSNIWTWALSYSANTLVVHALDQVLQATSLAIGNIQRDINLGIRNGKTGKATSPLGKPKAFIAHGGKSGVLDKLREFIQALGIDPIIVELSPSRTMSVDDKVKKYMQEADCGIVLATKGGIVDKSGKREKQHPRLNVIDEFERLRAIFPDRTILLLEQGVELPSNIAGLTHERFARQSMDTAFTAIARELTDIGILKAVKP